MTLEVIHRAAAVIPEHAARMRIVDHHDRAVLFGGSAQLRHRAEVAFHREDAVGDEQLALRRRQVPEDLAGGVHVLVWKHLDPCAAETAAVDDARVVQLVGNNDVFFRQHRGDGAGVGREPALKDDDGFDVLEGGEPALEFHVHLHRAGDRADGAGPDAVLADGVERGLLQLRVRRQAEVVVG